MSGKKFFASYYSMENPLRPLAGIVFDSWGNGNAAKSANMDSDALNQTAFDYRLRFSYKPKNSGESNLMKRDKDWKTGFTFPMFQILGPREGQKGKGGDPGYWREGFLTVQNALNKAIGEYLLKSSSSFSSTSSSSSASSSSSSSSSDYAKSDIHLKRFPYPPYIDDIFVNAIQLQFPLIFVISFVITVLDIVKNVTVEKEKKLKESMKIMGLSNWLHWSAWLFKCTLFVTLNVALITILLTIKWTPRGKGEFRF